MILHAKESALSSKEKLLSSKKRLDNFFLALDLLL